MRRSFLALAAALGCIDEPGSLVTGYPDGAAFPEAPFWKNVPAGGAAIVTNNYGDSLSIVDLAARASLGDLPVGLNPVEREGPHHDAVSPDGTRLFVGISNFVQGSGSGPHGAHGTGAADGYALMLDTATMALSASHRVDRSPGDVTVNAEGTRAYVSHFDLLRVIEAIDAGEPEEETYATIAVLDAATLEEIARPTVCPTPHGIRLSADGSQLYVACYNGDQIAIVDTETFEVTRVPVAPDVVPPPNARYLPNSVHVSPADGRVWIANLGTGELRVLDPAKRAIDTECIVQVGGQPYFGKFLDDGATFVLPVQGADATDLAWIDAASCEVAERQTLAAADCRAGHMLLAGPEGDDGPGYLVCEGNRADPGTFVFFDSLRPGGKVEAVVPVGVFPDGAVLVYPGLGINPP